MGLIGAAISVLASCPASAAPFDLKKALLHDVASPVAGDAKGDVTIVVFSDYNCPYCRRSDGALDTVVASDSRVRVVYKDWPILAKSSVTAAKIAIAANLQGQYAAVHHALMQMHARPATDEDIGKAVVASGADVARLNKDLDQRDGEIVALLKRNIEEADALKLNGTPVYVIGPFVEANALDVAGFRQVIADVRAQGRNLGATTR